MDFHASSSRLQLPFTYMDLRQSARTGYELDDRRFYWPHIVTFPPKSTVAVLANTPVLAQRMYDRVSILASRPMPDGRLSDMRLSWKEDEGVVVQVMRALCAHFPINQPGLLEPLVRHVSRVLDNTAICFYFFCGYMDKSYWYSIPNLTAHRYKLNTFRELAKRCMKNTYAILNDIGALDEPFLNLIFVDMLSDLLPDEYFFQVLDMYFIEGYKILYRFGLAILKVNKAKIKCGSFKNGVEFWDAVKNDAKKTSFDFTSLFNFAFDIRSNNFFKISIVPGRSRLQAFEAATRSVMTLDELTAPLQQNLSCSVDNTVNLEPDSCMYLHSKSMILDETSAAALHSFLLPAAQIEGFDLMYSTYEDGWNLQTLYNKTQYLSPCIILVKTMGSNSSATMGMFVSTEISPPSYSIRGDGQCFCFRLDGSDPKCYRWVGQTEDSVQSLPSTKLQFAICTVDYMAFGGSTIHGTNALRLSSDLMTCNTGESDTYNNPPLVPQNHITGKGGYDLDVSCVEVFCGKMSVEQNHSK